MSLCLDRSDRSEYLKFIARFCGVSTASAGMGSIRLRVGKKSTTNLVQLHTIVRYFARASDREDELLGHTPLEIGQIAQWLSFVSNLLDGTSCPAKAAQAHLKVLNQVLSNRVYFVSNRPTLADACLFWIVYSYLENLKSPKVTRDYVHVCRWFDLMQHSLGIMGFTPKHRPLDFTNPPPAQFAFPHSSE